MNWNAASLAIGLPLLAWAIFPISRTEAEPIDQVIRIVAPTPPGSPPDVASRIIADGLSSSEQWKVIVENRPGALQTIALAEVLRQPSNGLTIFPLTVGAMASPALLPE